LLLQLQRVGRAQGNRTPNCRFGDGRDTTSPAPIGARRESRTLNLLIRNQVPSSIWPDELEAIEMVPGKQKATLSSGLASSSSYPCGCVLSYARKASSRFASIRFRSARRRQDSARSLRSFVSTAAAYAMPSKVPAVVTTVSSNFTPTHRRQRAWHSCDCARAGHVRRDEGRCGHCLD
jgi:hypothetical protein